jgi:protease IV
LAATADMIIERRRVRRRLAFWRIVAIVAVVVALVSLLPLGDGVPGNHVARVTLDGIILDDAERERAILDIAEDDDALAMILRVNSPGGTVVASEVLYDAVRAVAEQKPVVVVMDEIAASGGYVAALAGERILARGNTLTGSIGVVMEAPNIAGLLDKLGIDVTRVKSGPLKAEPSLIAPLDPQALRAQEELIEDTFAWFRGLVSERRGLEGAALARVTDGRVFTGRQALELGLIDGVGDEKMGLDWLAGTHGIDRDVEVVDRRWGQDVLPWPFRRIGDGAVALEQLERLVAAGPRLYALIR